MATEKEKHFDKVFETLGQFKMFTFVQSGMMLLACFPAAYQLLSNSFIAMANPHRCAAGPNDSTDVLSGLDDHNEEDLTVSYQQCEILVSLNHTVLKRLNCIHGMDYDLPVDSSVVSQFDLVCDRSSFAKLSQTLVVAGGGLGSTVFSLLSDRYGRKPVFILCHTALGVCVVAIAYAPNFGIFAACKLLAGALQQGSVGAISSILLEMMTTENRRVAICVTGSAWGIGTVSLSLWAYIMRDLPWRTVQMALSLSSITFVLEIMYLKESLRWLIANGKEKAVKAYLSSVTTINNTSYERAAEVYKEVCQHQAEYDQEHDAHDTGTATKKLTLLELLRVKRLLLNASIIWLGWFTTALSFFSIYTLSTSLAGDPYLNFFLTAFMEIPNNFLLFFIFNRISRKRIMIVIFSTISLGLIMSGVFQSLQKNSFTSAMAVVCSCLSMSATSASWAVLFSYTSENFPTNMRHQAIGVSALVGRIGGMIAPFTSVLSEKAKWAPGIMIGCCSIVVCLAFIALPETRGRELPQTIEDVKAWFYKNKDKKQEQRQGTRTKKRNKNKEKEQAGHEMKEVGQYEKPVWTVASNGSTS